MPGLFDNTSGGGLFDTLGGIFSPQVAQQNIVRQTQQALYQSARTPKEQGGPGFSHSEAVEYALNPKAQEEFAKAHFGNPVSLGDFKVGDISSPVLGHDRGVVGIPGISGGGGGVNLQQLQAQSNEQAKNKELAIEQGKSQAAAEAALPNVQANVDEALRLIEEVKKDPNLTNVTGPIMGRNPFPIAPDTVAKIDQIKSLAQMQGLQGLRGFGRIFQTEFVKAGSAVQRLERTQTTKGFQTALDDAKKTLEGFRDRALTAAGKPGAAQPAAPSGVVDYKTYFGGK